MAGAPKGNKNAEVWTDEVVLDKIESIIDVLKSNVSEYTLGGALIEVGLYPQWWSEMAQKFKENRIVSEAIKKTEFIIEQRIVNDTMTGDAKSATFSIFLLKNKFGYVDKQETENTHSINNVNLKDMVSFGDKSKS